MPEVDERDDRQTRIEDPRRRSQELQETFSRLHGRLLETAEAVRRSHEQAADGMELLAELGRVEHRARRRRMAEQSRELAQKEARHIAELKKRRLHQDGNEDDE